MLKRDDGIYCGIFNSSIIRRAAERSTERTVECYELELFHEAAGISHINGIPHRTRRGMLLCAKPGQRRFSIFPVKCSFIRIFPSQADDSLCTVLASLPDVTYINEESDTDTLLALFARLGACFASKDESLSGCVKINGLFYEILYSIIRLSESAHTTAADCHSESTARKAYEYIRENYRQDCRLKTVADAINISPNYLHTVFTRTFGVTPYEFALSKRIEKAKTLIMTGERTMLEIALSVGFCSQSHFNKVFIKRTGMTPANYRKSLMEQY